MPVVTDHDAVPLTPVYTIVISENDEASVDGHPVDKLPGQDARAAALANIQERAARLDRPVRVTAKEPDGSSWPLIVDYDGEVTPLDQPHPTPPTPPAARPAPEQPPAPTAPVHLPPPTGEPVIPGPARAAGDVDWMAPLPPEYQEMLDAVKAAEQAGNLAAAEVAAQDLEDALEDAFGPAHPYTVNVVAVRASFAVRRAAWAIGLELHMRAAWLRHDHQAPREETLRLARNAHFCWKHLVATCRKHPGTHNQAEAQRRVQDLLRMLRHVGVEPIIITTTEEWAAKLLPVAS
ncbi:hypothetical protein ACQEU8_36445 [Streptomyces sp. CA-250714]|uniref:hypothetical protein n=1 Tax=Streptomyces sp. CA-250714 TaxID=3240060 RepID=UPI003D93E027